MNLLKRKAYQHQEILGIVNNARRQQNKSDANNGRITEVQYAIDENDKKLFPAKYARYVAIKSASDAETDNRLPQPQRKESLGKEGIR